MSVKKSYKNDIIRFAFLGVALAVFFIGPHLVQSDRAEDIQDVIEDLRKSKNIKVVRELAINQLEKDRQFAQQNNGNISIATIKMPAVYWLSLLIIILGLGAPLIMKYFDNKKVQQ